MKNEIQNLGQWLETNRNNPAKKWQTEVAIERLRVIQADKSLSGDIRHSAAEAEYAGL